MNYQDYQKNKERKFPIGAKVTPGDSIKIEKKHTPKRKILDILSEPQYPNLGAIVAVICMLVFWNTQIIPAILSWITFTLFLISYAKGKSKGWLPWIWAFNASIWTLHQIIG